MARYKAKWIYGPQTGRSGQIKAECEADSLPEFAKNLCNEYAYNLSDDFWFGIYNNEAAIKDSFGEGPEGVPDWVSQITAYPVYYFGGNFGDEILCNPSATKIINQIAGEGYGDYDLKISGI